MENAKIIYCPVVGKCPHEPIFPEQDTYFLIQPFDNDKENREEAIKIALDSLYGSRKGHYPNNKAYSLKKSDSEIGNIGVYCDICRKIKSSQYCIVDITGESYTILEDTNTRKKTFLRPNVPLELGMSYGLNKPVFILSRKIDGKHEIPSDLQFIRYIDVSPNNTTMIEFGDWEGAAQKILDHLREVLPPVYIKTLILDRSPDYKAAIESLEWLYHVRELSQDLENKSLKISQIIYKDRDLIGIIIDGKFLKEGLKFNLYITDEDGIEEQIGIAECYHVQRPSGICQVKIYRFDSTSKYRLEQIAMDCEENKMHIPKNNRLQLIIPDKLNSMIEEIELIVKRFTGEL